MQSGQLMVVVYSLPLFVVNSSMNLDASVYIFLMCKEFNEQPAVLPQPV